MPQRLYVDKELLYENIEKSGLKIGFICEQLGLSRQAFWKKVNGLTRFRVSEVYVLCSLLSLTDNERAKIFYPITQPTSC